MIDKKDIKKIFDQYYDALVRYANRFLASVDECEDLVQDVFIDYWVKENLFPDEIYLKVYLYRAVRNKCLNVIKHNQVKSIYAKNFIGSQEDEDAFFNELLREDVLAQLNKAIALLPNRKKEIIKMSLQGLKNSQIAEELGINLQSVKTHRTESYKILREHFKDLEVILYFLLFGKTRTPMLT